jgi:hypothetical protein
MAQQIPNNSVPRQRIGGRPPQPAAPKSLGMKRISKRFDEYITD